MFLKFIQLQIWGKYRKRWYRKSRKSLFFPLPFSPPSHQVLSPPTPFWSLEQSQFFFPPPPRFHRGEPRLLSAAPWEVCVLEKPFLTSGKVGSEREKSPLLTHQKWQVPLNTFCTYFWSALFGRNMNVGRLISPSLPSHPRPWGPRRISPAAGKR